MAKGTLSFEQRGEAIREYVETYGTGATSDALTESNFFTREQINLHAKSKKSEEFVEAIASAESYALGIADDLTSGAREFLGEAGEVSLARIHGISRDSGTTSSTPVREANLSLKRAFDLHGKGAYQDASDGFTMLSVVYLAKAGIERGVTSSDFQGWENHLNLIGVGLTAEQIQLARSANQGRMFKKALQYFADGLYCADGPVDIYTKRSQGLPAENLACWFPSETLGKLSDKNEPIFSRAQRRAVVADYREKLLSSGEQEKLMAYANVKALIK